MKARQDKHIRKHIQRVMPEDVTTHLFLYKQAVLLWKQDKKQHKETHPKDIARRCDYPSVSVQKVVLL